MQRRILFVLLSTFVGFSAVSQQEENEMEEVIISGSSSQSLNNLHLDQKRIENKLAPDLGAILALLPGLQIRTYGDVGGLKTAGFRSLGAAHSSIVIDLQNQPVTQTGSTDLSSIPTEFIKSVAILRQDGTNTGLPIQSKLSGSLIHISTIHQSVSSDSSMLRVGLQNGSFGYYSGDLAARLRYKKIQLSITGKARTYEGNFPFEYQNAYQTISAVRKNNGCSDLNVTTSLTWFLNKSHTISVKGTINDAKKELAGAVVFYNETANQHLFSGERNLTLWHKFELKRSQWITQLTTQNSDLTYLDSNYLNQQGYLEQSFYTNYLNGQTQYALQINKVVKLSIGSEISHERIFAGTVTGNPERTTLNQFLASKFAFSNHDLEVQVGVQQVVNQRGTGTKNLYVLPALQYVFAFKKIAAVGFIVRYTVRQPTFSELYYQQVGNTSLKPEEASLASLPVKFTWKKGNWYNSFRLEPFYTYSINKIVAIPTKNLFVWSIQNIGISQSSGCELFNESKIKLKNSIFGQSVSFTYQEAIDLTNPNSVLYRSQLTYIPKFSGSVELDWSLTKWSVYTLFSAQSMRYGLQENITSNEVPGYYTVDLGASYMLQLKKQKFKVSACVKNITNQYNQYIRYFVLPGINYQIRLAYEI